MLSNLRPIGYNGGVVAEQVITSGELLPLVGSNRLRLLDAREPDSYREGHIPGAASLPPSVLEHTDLLESGADVGHQLRPESEVVEYLLAAGVRDDTPVCVYDDGGGYLAARLWWVLECVGHPRPRLLDGGVFSWTSSGGELSTDVEPLLGGSLTVRPAPRRRLDFSDMIATMGDARTVLCNTLPARTFAARAIPGSINIPYTDTFAPDNVLLLKSRYELASMFALHGVGRTNRLVCYCDIGYSACQVYFAARYAGFPDAAVYDGSMADWRARGGDLVPGTEEG